MINFSEQKLHENSDWIESDKFIDVLEALLIKKQAKNINIKFSNTITGIDISFNISNNLHRLSISESNGSLVRIQLTGSSVKNKQVIAFGRNDKEVLNIIDKNL